MKMSIAHGLFLLAIPMAVHCGLLRSRRQKPDEISSDPAVQKAYEEEFLKAYNDVGTTYAHSLEFAVAQKEDVSAEANVDESIAAAPAPSVWTPINPNPALPASQCTPQCTWQCGTRKCDEVCKPKCQAPRCQTRCTGMSTTGCKMRCGKPRCSVVCSSRTCAGNDCPKCQSHCGPPMCKLQCPRGTQNCRDVCESPSCTWECSAPTNCPRPECRMACESPKPCLGVIPGGDLPTLGENEVIVDNFQAPVSLQQHIATEGAKRQADNVSVLSFPVQITRRSLDVSGALKLVQHIEHLPVEIDST